MSEKKKVIIIGAGPAGLTAAYELLQHPDFIPIVFEADSQVGGISKTVNYKGNRIDLGGHRFFSKVDKIKDWWLSFLPLADDRNKTEDKEKTMLVRDRLSRIYFKKKFFNYPVSLNLKTLTGLGFFYSLKIFFSYLKIKIFPLKQERSLEDFFINRFGKELYRTFFKDYTEKLWGVPCSQIKPEWGAQRIKALSLTKTVLHALKKIFIKNNSFEQRGTETSLIEKFLYPKFGPGQLWEEVAKQIEGKGGVIKLNHKVIGINLENDRVVSIKIENKMTHETYLETGDYFISSMPIKNLINAFNQIVSKEILDIANDLKYRDFITVGLLLKKAELSQQDNGLSKDTWVYMQEPGVKMVRFQIFNNWSPYLLAEQNKVWLGLEYVCDVADEIWQQDDQTTINFALSELSSVGVIKKENFLDAVVIKMEKAYPSYFGGYEKLNQIRNYLDKIPNLFLVGRNGLHRYNNMDHSMLTAMETVNNIIENKETKDNIWAVNAEEEYHEKK